MASVFVLGPWVEATEPFPVTPPPSLVGRKQVVFGKPATVPGGIVNVTVLAGKETDVMPTNIYAFYAQPIADIPSEKDLTPDFFFKGGYPSGSMHTSGLPENGRLTIKVPNVRPSLDPYRVQLVLEFPA